MVDKVGLIAASGSITKPSFNRAIEKTTSFGFEAVYSDSIFNRFLYYAGSDKERAKQINDMYLNSEVNLIFCVRGGHGLIHAMPFIDFDLINKNYKPIIGFSDYTILLNYLYTKFGQIHFHGPNLGQIFSDEDYSIDFMKNVVLAKQDAVFDFKQEDVLIQGSAVAHIVGGNLALLIRSIGTPYEFDSTNKIILIEASGKFSAWIYESLFQLYLAGKFDSCKGIIFGSFKDCGIYDKYIDLFTKKYFLEKNIPVIKNQLIGHDKPNLTVPIGGICNLNTSNSSWSISTNGLI